MLAVALDLRVWSLATTPAVEVRPQYAPDRAAGPQDLLDADREARPLAALVASADLKPPLTVGLFGAWGSGKPPAGTDQDLHRNAREGLHRPRDASSTSPS